MYIKLKTKGVNIPRGIINRIPFKILKNIFPSYHIIPVYHVVSNNELPHIKHLYKIKTKREFITELDFFNKYYNFASIEEILKGNKKNCIHLTFDDGYKECFDVIMPILLEKGIPATFFINTDFIGNQKLMSRCTLSLVYDEILKTNDKEKLMLLETWAKGFSSIKDWIFSIYKINDPNINKLVDFLKIDIGSYLKEVKPYLEHTQIKILADKGFSIGSHGKSHANFKHLKLEEQLQETLDTTNFISKTYHQKHKLFSFPYHDLDISLDFFYNIQSHVDLTFGTTGFYQDHAPQNLQRIWMEAEDNHNCKDYFSLKYKSKVYRKYKLQHDFINRQLK